MSSATTNSRHAADYITYHNWNIGYWEYNTFTTVPYKISTPQLVGSFYFSKVLSLYISNSDDVNGVDQLVDEIGITTVNGTDKALVKNVWIPYHTSQVFFSQLMPIFFNNLASGNAEPVAANFYFKIDPTKARLDFHMTYQKFYG